MWGSLWLGWSSSSSWCLCCSASPSPAPTAPTASTWSRSSAASLTSRADTRSSPHRGEQRSSVQNTHTTLVLVYRLCDNIHVLYILWTILRVEDCTLYPINTMSEYIATILFVLRLYRLYTNMEYIRMHTLFLSYTDWTESI